MVVSPSRWRHLVGRFFGALAATMDPDSLQLVDAYLSSTERSLFLTMTVSDQRHSIDLGHRLRNDGHDEPELLRAALLHDVGKAAGSVPLAYRVVYSLLMMTMPRIAKMLGRSGEASWRRPFYLAANHPAIGAAAAERAGSSSAVVWLIRGHNRPGTDGLSRILYSYDRGM